MSFSESDYLIIIRKINEILEDKEKNAIQAFFEIKKLMAIYKKLCIYPSVVSKILDKNIQPVDIKSLEKGDEILAITDKDSILGTVKEISNDENTVKLVEVSKITEYRSKTFKIEDLKTVFCIQQKKDTNKE